MSIATKDLKEEKYITSVAFREYAYSWVINNFSAWHAQVEGKQISSIFPSGDNVKYQWQLCFLPKTKHTGIAGIEYDGLAVNLVTYKDTRVRFLANYEVTMTNSMDCIIQQRTFIQTKSAIGQQYIDSYMIQSEALIKKIQPDDVLIIKCKIIVIAEITNESTNNNRLPTLLPSSLSSDFRALIDNNDKFGDVTVLVDGQRFLAYKGILAARSSVFAVMFENQMRESIESSVSIDDIEPEVFKEVLRYIYTDELTCLDTMAHKLYAAADKYAIATLKSRCRYHILEKLCWETAAETLLFADLHSDEDMKRVALQFLSGSVAAKVTGTDGWKEMVSVRPDLVDEVVRALAGAKITSGPSSDDCGK